jgi:hypothetical protein
MGGELTYRRGQGGSFALVLPAGEPGAVPAAAPLAEAMPPDPFPPRALLDDYETLSA